MTYEFHCPHCGIYWFGYETEEPDNFEKHCGDCEVDGQQNGE